MNFVTRLPQTHSPYQPWKALSGTEPSLGFHFHFSPNIFREKWLPPEYPLAPSTDANEQTTSKLTRKWMWVTRTLSLPGLLRHHWHWFLPSQAKIMVCVCPLLGDGWSEGAPLKGCTDLFSWNRSCIYLPILRFASSLKCTSMNKIKLREQTLLKGTASSRTESQTNRIESKPVFFYTNIKKHSMKRQVRPRTTRQLRVEKQ